MHSYYTKLQTMFNNQKIQQLIAKILLSSQIYNKKNIAQHIDEKIFPDWLIKDICIRDI